METQHTKRRRVVRNRWIDDQAGVDDDEDSLDDDEDQVVQNDKEGEQGGGLARRDRSALPRLETRCLGSRDGAPQIFDGLIARVEGPQPRNNHSTVNQNQICEESPDEESPDEESPDEEAGYPQHEASFDPESPLERTILQLFSEADTALYRVKCEPGCELLAIMYLMQRAVAEDTQKSETNVEDQQSSKCAKEEVPLNSLIRSAFMGKKTGNIYVEVTSWNVRDPVLRGIFHSTPGLLYPSRFPGGHPVRFHPGVKDSLPAAEFVERNEWHKVLHMTGTGFLPGDFVQIGRHSNYRGDVGLVVDLDRKDLSSVPRVRVLVPPRIPFNWRLKLDQAHFNKRALEYSSEDRLDPNHRDFYPRPFHYKEWLAAGWKWKADLVPHCRTHRCMTPKDSEVPNVEGHCRPCQDWENCTDAYLVFQGREFEHMLESIWVKTSRLRKAESIELHAGICLHISQFQLQLLHDSFSDLPPPRGWDFTVGDRVFIVKPHVTPEEQPEKFLLFTLTFLKHCPDESRGCEGTIVSVSAFTCTVKLDHLPGLAPQATKSPHKLSGVTTDDTAAFDFQPLESHTSDPEGNEDLLVSVSKHHIRRSLRPGDEVEVIYGIEKGSVGWVFDVTDDWNAVIMVNDVFELDLAMSQQEPHMVTTPVNFLRPHQPSTANQVPRQLTRTFGVAAAPDAALANAGLVPPVQMRVHHGPTERNPWIGTPVRVIKHKGGLKDSGVVRSVHVAPPAPIGRPNKTNNVSGLIINIELDTRRQRTGDLAVDYDNVRDLDSGRFLNQVRPLAEDSFWKEQFRPFYFERYTDKEEREIREREENRKLQEIERVERMREEAERRLVASSNRGTPPPSDVCVDDADIGTAWDPAHVCKSPVDWLTSRAIANGLQGMKVLVDIIHGPYKGKDRYIHLEYDGEDRPYKIIYYPPRVQRRLAAFPVDLADLDKSSDRPKLRTEARMMIVTEGDHIGKLVYWVGQRYISDNQSDENARLILRVVVNLSVVRCTCEISEEELLLHESSLAIVKDDTLLRSHVRHRLDTLRQENKNKLYL
ncbi:hypothetical protein AAF712_014103 [Marasmius tenuissimus]|uniref:Uncharacterized protein n=1 Tax=Marasmius tenuissimus TaxID=585030 RepID=A0ABR2ZD82_9AGAR